MSFITYGANIGSEYQLKHSAELWYQGCQQGCQGHYWWELVNMIWLSIKKLMCLLRLHGKAACSNCACCSRMTIPLHLQNVSYFLLTHVQRNHNCYCDCYTQLFLLHQMIVDIYQQLFSQ